MSIYLRYRLLGDIFECGIIIFLSTEAYFLSLSLSLQILHVVSSVGPAVINGEGGRRVCNDAYFAFSRQQTQRRSPTQGLAMKCVGCNGCNMPRITFLYEISAFESNSEIRYTSLINRIGKRGERRGA